MTTFTFATRERMFMAAFIAELGPHVQDVADATKFPAEGVPVVREKLLAELPTVDLTPPEREFLTTLVGGTGDQWWGDLPARSGLRVMEDLHSLYYLLAEQEAGDQ